MFCWKEEQFVAGYALALEKVLNYVGIEARDVLGYAYGDPNLGHAWNQVRIDGKWYNTDLCWDYKRIRESRDLDYCLRSDEEFYKDHTATDTEQKCSIDYSREEIKDALELMHSEYDADQEKYGQVFPNLVGLQNYREVAQTTAIEPTLISDIKAAVEGKDDRKSEQAYIQEQ